MLNKIILELENILGKNHVLSTESDTIPYITDWRKRYTGKAFAVLLPGSAKEVSEILKICSRENISIVTQGGNTGLCGGATPDNSGKQIVLNLKRMNQIYKIDTKNQTIKLEAGCILQVAQETALASGFLLPLSLGAEGSCMIGGNLATNAGGTNVLRYGNVRELCLGLEVVTAKGEIWSSLKGLRKDNTGYDLRDLFIGSEGTLGIITAAVMKLYPLPIAKLPALVATQDIGSAISLLNLFQKRAFSLLTGFEMMTEEAISLNQKHFPLMSNSFNNNYAYTVLIELSDWEGESHVYKLLESTLEEAFEKGLIIDAVIASNLSQANSFWQMREHITLAQAAEGSNLKYDVSVPISNIEDFILDTNKLMRANYPGIRLINFGHLGDGNLHYNVSPPEGANADSFIFAHEKTIEELIYGQVEFYGGSISAEHGIGQLKLGILEQHNGIVAYELMKSIKKSLDPKNILNPNKLISA